jgi:transposase
MRKIKEILRLRYELKRSHRDIANSVRLSTSTISECIKRAKEAGLSWPLPADTDDEALEDMLYRKSRRVDPKYKELDFVKIHQELKRKNVTLYVLWYEYKGQYPEGLGYSRFCDVYRDWKQTIDVTMRQNYRFGEKLFIDYAGVKLSVVSNIQTGELKEVEIFVAALGASNYTYVEATWTQSLPDWIGSHVRAFKFFGGLAEILVPDNLKSAVTNPHLYEPDLNPTYQDMAQHYGVGVLPTRVRSPRDKAKVEEAVQHIERRILARLRNRTFFSLEEVNQAIRPLLEEVNRQPFQKLPEESRLSQFEKEKSSLKPLPANHYVFAEWKKAKAGIDYHIALDGHYYSVPFTLVKKTLDVRYTTSTVEVFNKGKRVASHIRSYKKGRHTTVKEHMPKKHQKYAEWTPERIINWANTKGASVGKLARKIIEKHVHPALGYRSCMGLIRLGEGYGDRLEKACKRALAINAISYKNVESILRNNLDTQPLPQTTEEVQITAVPHDYVRGDEYYY